MFGLINEQRVSGQIIYKLLILILFLPYQKWHICVENIMTQIVVYMVGNLVRLVAKVYKDGNEYKILYLV